jgi:Sulfotransferase domain
LDTSRRTALPTTPQQDSAGQTPRPHYRAAHVQAADTLLLTIPNQLGVDYNAHLLESILAHVGADSSPGRLNLHGNGHGLSCAPLTGRFSREVMVVLEVIGVGFGRTGTLSLKLALERLGRGPCHHMIELIDDPGQQEMWARVAAGDPPDWNRLYRGYRATVDWPGVRFWRELTSRFPEAKVILTVRDPRAWYRSVSESIYRVSAMPVDDPLTDARRQIVSRFVWEGEFGGRFTDAEYAMKVFTEHNDAVRREIPPGRLLEYEISQGWRPLCDFLGVPVPDAPFPHSNDQREFAERVARLRTGR